MVSKVTRTGLLQERVYLEYSQERLAAYGVKVGALDDVLGARNITLPGGMIEVGDKNLTVDPVGRVQERAGDRRRAGADRERPRRSTCATSRPSARGYESPARFLNFYSQRGDGRRAGAARARSRWPCRCAPARRSATSATPSTRALDELQRAAARAISILARTSDQPRQVEENIDLFMGSLYEAVALVVLVSLIGFWEWRSALLMALSIPITLAMTFGMMYVLGIDLQQVSIASLIIALGLLVDDPVVAGDAIKRDLAAGHPPRRRRVARARRSWPRRSCSPPSPTSSPTCRSCCCRATPGAFLYSLPVVIGCSLVASRLVSMTFIPLLGYYLLRPKAEPSIEERRKSGFAALLLPRRHARRSRTAGRFSAASLRRPRRSAASS